MYEIKLANGTILKDLKMNGNNYVSSMIINDETFESNLMNVSITGPEGTQIFEDMTLIQNKIYGLESWFILSEKTDEEKIKILAISRNRELEDAIFELAKIIAEVV